MSESAEKLTLRSWCLELATKSGSKGTTAVKEAEQYLAFISR
jgi:hypothetical protein